MTALLLLRAHWAADTFGLGKVRKRVDDDSGGADAATDDTQPLPPTCPILLHSQLHALVTDRGAADVELDELRCVCVGGGEGKERRGRKKKKHTTPPHTPPAGATFCAPCACSCPPPPPRTPL